MNVGPLHPDEIPIKIEDRPRPIKNAADHLKSWLGFLTLIVGGSTGAGINLLTDDQANALTALLASIPSVVGTIAVVLTAFGIVKRSEPLVTPMVDPRDNDGSKLLVVEPRRSAGGMLG